MRRRGRRSALPVVVAVLAALWVVLWRSDEPKGGSEATGQVEQGGAGVGRRALDGDTLLVDADGDELRVRIFGIDSPERGQPFADVARRRLGQMVEGKRLGIEAIERDRLGRLVARLQLEDGRDVATEMLGEGLAWHFTRYSRDRRYAEAERRARSERQGLWQDREPVPPWEWRQEHPVQSR